jgi:hypothetical protein
MIEFQISTKHTGQYRRIKVFVYDTVAELKRAARKRDGFYGWPQESRWYDQMAATTQSHIIDQVDDVGEVTSSKPYVTMRLAKDELHRYPTEIITHESAHAALFLYRHDLPHDVPGHENEIILENLEAEETLCYLVGEISRKVVNKLHEKAVL